MELNLLTDIYQYLLIGEGIKGGEAMISYWYAWAKAPGMENYDTNKRNSYIIYLDANSLYSMARCYNIHPFLFSNGSQTRTWKN